MNEPVKYVALARAKIQRLRNKIDLSYVELQMNPRESLQVDIVIFALWPETSMRHIISMVDFKSDENLRASDGFDEI